MKTTPVKKNQFRWQSGPAVLVLALALAGGVAQAQKATVKGTVSARGAAGAVSSVKIVVIDRKDSKNLNVVSETTAANGQYEISLDPGSYEIFACDPKMAYEPHSRLAEVSGKPVTKDIHLSDNPVQVHPTDENDKPIGANVAVCVQHLESTCKVEMTTGADGTVTIPGVESHFRMHVRGDKPCE